MSSRPHVATEEQLLAATYRVVSRMGPNLTLADAAKEAGVSPAALVQRFGSKRGLLLAVAARASADVAGEFARIRAAHRSPLATVFAIADCTAALATSPQTLANSLAFLQIDLTDPDFHRHALAHSRAMHTQLQRLLDEAVSAGELLKCDTNRLANAVQSLITGSLLECAIHRDGKVGDRLRADLDTLLKPRHCPPRERRRHQRRPVRRT